MNNKITTKYHDEYEYNYDDEDEDDDSESYFEEEESEELYCKNMDPSLAKLMGIIIEEQKNIDWTPPLKSGLDNSKEIFSPTFLRNKHFVSDIDFDFDYFKIIK